MTKFGFYFQKFAIIIMLIATMVTVIPFILILIEMAINGNGAFGNVMLEHIFITTFEEWNGLLEDELPKRAENQPAPGDIKNDPKVYYENHVAHPIKQG